MLGIIGNPVRSSLSPAMQRAALRRLELDACYRAFEIAPGQVRTVLRALPPLGFWGINVTIPYKEKVLPLLDEVDAVGQRDRRRQHRRGPGRAAARVQHRRRGVPPGPGDRGRTELPGARVLVVGAGGAARAVAFACLARGCRSLLIANRSGARARSLCRALRVKFPGGRHRRRRDRGTGLAASGGSLRGRREHHPAGRRPDDPLPVPQAALRRGQTVMDIVYRPRRTPLLAAAAAAGARTVDGLQMLLHQGALAFTLWTGREAPPAVMRRALAAAAARAERRA